MNSEILELWNASFKAKITAKFDLIVLKKLKQETSSHCVIDSGSLILLKKNLVCLLLY